MRKEQNVSAPMLPFDYISKYTQIYFTFHGSTQNIKKENRMKIIITHPIQINNSFILDFLFFAHPKKAQLWTRTHSLTSDRIRRENADLYQIWMVF